MREIEFKGKTNTNKWVYGGIYINGNEHVIISDLWGNFGDTYCDDYIVIPETVGQYIGIKDSRGKKIFENDILLVLCDGERSIHKVSWGGPEYPAFHLEPLLSECHNCFSEIVIHGGYKTRAIGNIHENPELLEGK